MLVIICAQYRKIPSRSVGVKERTRNAGRSMNKPTTWCKSGRVGLVSSSSLYSPRGPLHYNPPLYPPTTSMCRGYNNESHISKNTAYGSTPIIWLTNDGGLELRWALVHRHFPRFHAVVATGGVGTLDRWHRGWGQDILMVKHRCGSLGAGASQNDDGRPLAAGAGDGQCRRHEDSTVHKHTLHRGCSLTAMFLENLVTEEPRFSRFNVFLILVTASFSLLSSWLIGSQGFPEWTNTLFVGWHLCFVF